MQSSVKCRRWSQLDLAGRFAQALKQEKRTSEQETTGVIGDRERIAVLAIAEQELAFVIRTPELVGPLSRDNGVPWARRRTRPRRVRENASVENPTTRLSLRSTTRTSRTMYPLSRISGNRPIRFAISKPAPQKSMMYQPVLKGGAASTRVGVNP
jgi:hypothetical protein